MVDSEEALPKILKAPARVLGYIRPNYLRVIVLPGVGMVGHAGKGSEVSKAWTLG